MKRLLVQTQLSNYDTNGKFILEADSGWQMVMGRVREMLKLNSELHIDVMGPWIDLNGQRQVITSPYDLNLDLFATGRLNYIEHWIQPNALKTRFDFHWQEVASSLNLDWHRSNPLLRYNAVYVNDPMHLKNFKALFSIEGGYQPKFFVHSHFIDNPECPKFPTETSLWLGQCEAAIRADHNFWQCRSSMDTFFSSMSKQFQPDVVDAVKEKSTPWDDGYSSTEINLPISMKKMRFTWNEWCEKTRGQKVIFVPNRIGGKGRSSDYTNCGRFMFELLPQLRKLRKDFVVICGNPNQKILNSELEEWCGENGYVSLVPDAFNRDEFKFVARHSHIALGLYDQDTYGGTVARECIELGCWPLWLDVNEYSSIAREAGNYPFMVAPDWSDFVTRLSTLIQSRQFGHAGSDDWNARLLDVVKRRCSYEATTPEAMKIMGLL